MPWDNQAGKSKGGGGRGPWGQGGGGGGGGGGGMTPPDLEDLLRKGQDRLKQAFPSGQIGRGAGLIAGLVVLVVWLGSGVYVVEPDEQGVVLTFGEYTDTTTPGIRYHWPWPVQSVLTPKVTRENQINIGFRTEADTARGERPRDVVEESLMLTGDENIVDIDVVVTWVIADAGKFLFNVENPEDTIKVASESAMREVIGRLQFQAVTTADRARLEQDVLTLTQQILESYGAGVQVTGVRLQKADPPAAVIDAFRDVQAARADAERSRNEAEAYANRVIPEARGEAERIIQGAEAYKQQVVAEAQGEAQRFISVYNEYAKAPEVTRRRIFIETMERVMTGTNKVIVDGQGGQGVVPYLPLPELQRRSQQPAVQQPQAQPQQ